MLELTFPTPHVSEIMMDIKIPRWLQRMMISHGLQHWISKRNEMWNDGNLKLRI